MSKKSSVFLQEITGLTPSVAAPGETNDSDATSRSGGHWRQIDWFIE